MQIYSYQHSRAFAEEKRLWITRNSMKIGTVSECVKQCFVYSTWMNVPQQGLECFFVLQWLETVCVSCSLLNVTLFLPCCGSTCHFSLLPVEEHTHAHTRAKKAGCLKSPIPYAVAELVCLRGLSRPALFVITCSNDTLLSLFVFNHLKSHHTVFVGPFFSEWRLTAPLISPPSSAFSFLWT